MPLLSRLTATACTVACTVLALSSAARADALAEAVIDQHILPTYAQLTSKSAEFANLTQSDCAPTSEAVRNAWGAAFDAWVAASHLRFGPSEVDNRAFAIAFWPDSRAKTPKALRSLLSDRSPVVDTPEDFATASVAVRGFYALEYLFFDPAYADLGDPDYACAFVQAVARDLARNSAAILDDWEQDYADQLRTPAARYHSETEAHQELFKALTTGLEILADMRIGRPLGTFDAPKPNRAEARRSGRSLRHIEIQLQSLRELALLLSANDGALTAHLTQVFDKADRHADQLSDDPSLAGITDPQKRFLLETLQQDVFEIKEIALRDLGSKLGVEAGFNALDGD
ncbi:MAG: imelysin family protein [Epibacterium sp.]